MIFCPMRDKSPANQICGMFVVTNNDYDCWWFFTLLLKSNDVSPDLCEDYKVKLLYLSVGGYNKHGHYTISMFVISTLNLQGHQHQHNNILIIFNRSQANKKKLPISTK